MYKRLIYVCTTDFLIGTTFFIKFETQSIVLEDHQVLFKAQPILFENAQSAVLQGVH